MKPILNLYKDRFSRDRAFDTAYSRAGKEAIVRVRDCEIRTKEAWVYYRWYDTFQRARENELCQQWGGINFFVDLPENVKNHYLSRIRWVADDKFYSSSKTIQSILTQFN